MAGEGWRTTKCETAEGSVVFGALPGPARSLAGSTSSTLQPDHPNSPPHLRKELPHPPHQAGLVRQGLGVGQPRGSLRPGSLGSNSASDPWQVGNLRPGM